MVKGDGFCFCGCGERTTVWRGVPHVFVYGHQARGKFNSRFGAHLSPQTLEKIANTKRERGKPSCWLGRKHSLLSRQKMSASKIGHNTGPDNPFYGRTHSSATKEKLRRAALLQRASRQFLPTIPEQLVQAELQDRGINFIAEYLINNKFCVDIFVPRLNLIIFVEGCYWHACPLCFPERRKPRTDNARIAYLTKCGYTVVCIWEHAIKDNPSKCIERILG